jgi:predicted carbohydrate-binding protein with CBM5 and CBM33 domain
MARGFKKDSNPFAALDEDFKTAIESGTDQEIRNKVSEVAFNEQENQRMKAEDIQLQEAKAAAKEAGEQYAEATKMNKLRIKYAFSVLDARGKV